MLFARGERAQSEGKANVARIYYEMAARLATGKLKGKVSARLEAAGRSQSDSSVVQSGP